jgi:F420-dependent oxidoreductase-like protein
MIGTPLGIVIVLPPPCLSSLFGRGPWCAETSHIVPSVPLCDDDHMKISTAINYAGDFRASAARARELEAAGVDMIWVAEAYGFDAVSLCGYLAAVTDRVELATGILPVFSRTPALLAQTAAGLDALSDGRFVLGLGASGPQVIEGWHGVAYDRPLARLRETVDICRMVWRRDRLAYHGRVFELPLPPDRGTGLGKPIKMINSPRRERIPIFLASLGERSVELCAEIADGWLPYLFVPERADAVWGAARRAGEAKRDPSLGALEIVAGGVLAIGDGAEAHRERARAGVALYVGGMGARGKNFYNDVVCSYGFADEARVIQDLYLAGDKEGAAAAVPDRLLEQLTLCGDRSYLRDRVAAFRDAGVTNLNVAPVDADAARTISQLREIIG